MPEYQDVDQKKNKIAFIHIILLNKTVRFLFLIAVAAVLLPAFGYMYFFSKEIDFRHQVQEKQIGTCAHASIYHVPCGAKSIDANNCTSHGCCYATEDGCFHSLPARHQYTFPDDETDNTTLIPLLNITSYDSIPLKELKIQIEEAANDRFSVSIYDASKMPKEVKPTNVADKQYSYELYKPTMFTEVFRTDPNETLIFSSARGPLMFGKDFFEWSFYLHYELLFGLGRGKLEVGDNILLFNNRSQFAIPFLMAYNNQTEKYHGLKFSATGPIELEILPSKLIVVKGMFSHQFKIEVMVGPSSSNVMRQMQASNDNTYIPPYWGWGVHLCSTNVDYNETATNISLTNLLDSKFPFDSHCIHDDMIRLTNTTNLNSTQSVVERLKGAAKQFLPTFSGLLENGTSEVYLSAVKQNILMLEPKSINPPIAITPPYIGEVLKRSVAYIDWYAENLSSFINETWKTIGGESFEGLMLQNSWMPDNRNVTKVPNATQVSYLPEQLSNSMNSSLRWNTTFSSSSSSTPLFERYNSLGLAALQTLQPVLGNNKYIISSSCTLESRAVCLIQNITQSWMQLNQVVELTISAAMAGLPLVGAPVCGDIKTAVMNEELCIRWYQFASLSPVFKVEVDRSPPQFSQTAQNIMNNVIRKRYSLLEYINTALLSDGAVLKPFFFEHPKMVNEFESIADQFFVGSSLIAAPVLFPAVSQIQLYFVEQFYEFWGGDPLPPYEVVNFAVVLNDLPLFIRSGHIVPRRLTNESTLNAMESKKQPLVFTVALNCSSSNCSANGELRPNNQVTIEFNANSEFITIFVRSTTTPIQDKLNLCDSGDFNGKIQSSRIYGHSTSKLIQHDISTWDLCADTFEWNKEISEKYL